jgi:hypothetical protein
VVTAWWVYYPPGLVSGLVRSGDAEQVGELVLGGVHVGEQSLGSGTAFAAVVVEQDGFADAGEFGEEFTYGQVQAGVFGVAAHEVGDGQREHAVEEVDADLLVGPVVHGAERHDVRVFELAEAGLGA